VSESELSITYADLLGEVGFFLGYGGDSSDWSARQLAECDRYVQAGYRRFLYPPATEGVEEAYPWSFLSPSATIDTVASTATQDLPADLGRVLGGFFYDSSQFRRSIVQVSETRYQELLGRTTGGGQPSVACVRHKPKTPDVGQRLEVSWWPTPDAAYALSYRYEAFAAKLADDNRYPLGGMRHGELIVQSCHAVAELRANDERGHHGAEFDRLLRSAVAQDRRIGAVHFGAMGHVSGYSDRPALPRHGETGGTYPVTYNGDTV